MPNLNAPRPTFAQQHGQRAILVLFLASILIGWPTLTGAQHATPAVAPAVANACATVLATGAIGASTPVSGSGDTAPTFDEIPFDLLALDTLSSHDEAVSTLLTVALAGTQQPELRQVVETSLNEYQTESIVLADARSAQFPDTPVVPPEYKTALQDEALAAAGLPAGSGEAPLIDPRHASQFLCSVGMTVPFDLAVIDLLSAEYQNGVAIGLLATQRAEDPALVALGQAIIDRETSLIGQLAIWRDAWFGPSVPVVVALTEDGHEQAAPSA